MPRRKKFFKAPFPLIVITGILSLNNKFIEQITCFQEMYNKHLREVSLIIFYRLIIHYSIIYYIIKVYYQFFIVK